VIDVIIGLAIGVVTGAIQFFLLFKFVTSVTGGNQGIKTLLFALTQFLFPFAILVVCAFLIPDSLMWVGIGVAATLIVCAAIRFIMVSKMKDAPKSKTKKK